MVLVRPQGQFGHCASVGTGVGATVVVDGLGVDGQVAHVGVCTVGSAVVVVVGDGDWEHLLQIGHPSGW
jgi:hypothetical protein